MYGASTASVGVPPFPDEDRGSLAAASGLLAVESRPDFPRRLTGATSDMTRNLIDLAFGAQVAITCRAARNLLGDALDLLSDSLDFLFRSLATHYSHAVSFLDTSVKQEVFRSVTCLCVTGNANDRLRRLSSQET